MKQTIRQRTQLTMLDHKHVGIKYPVQVEEKELTPIYGFFLGVAVGLVSIVVIAAVVLS